MADSTLNCFLARGTAAERAGFTPDPPTPASGPDPLHLWYETDTGDTYAWDGAAWDQVNSAAATPALDDLTDVDLTGAATGDVLTKDSGGDWVAAAPGGSYEAGTPTPPTTADLSTWDNQGTSTASDGTGALILKPQVDQVIHGLYKAAPATPYDVYCRVDLNWLSTAAITGQVITQAGILFKDTSGDNERLVFGLQIERISGDEQHLFEAQIQRWTGASPPVFSAVAVGPKYGSKAWQWLRVNNDGTTLTFYVGMDGKNWISVGTETLAAFIDAAASFGVYALGNSNSTEVIAAFSYFSTTAPA